MILITDTNILYSALIKPEGQVASVLKSKSNFQFFAPSYLFDELKEHWAEIENATSLTKKELKEEYEFYRSRIKSLFKFF
ncbi:PIN domain-containing protein [Capnocytophaga canimorsus]|uniref:PIN domain-containing protein n=1 Tax=Capnocytophaga canimorsus TaxID=28188 RepID=UPI00385C461D